MQCQKRHWKEGGHKRHCVAPEQRKVVATIKTSAVSVTGSEAIAAPEGSPKNCCGDKILNTHYAESTLDEKEEECAICLDSFAAEKGIRLPCSHVYHLDCVEKLREFGIQQVCPLCRADLPPGPGLVTLFQHRLRFYSRAYENRSCTLRDPRLRIVW